MDESVEYNNSVKELKELKERFLEMEDTLFSMNQKLDRLLEVMEKDCKKMSNHIDFVENVYENVKSPFHFIMNNVSNMVQTIASPGISNPLYLTQADEDIDVDG